MEHILHNIIEVIISKWPINLTLATLISKEREQSKNILYLRKKKREKEKLSQIYILSAISFFYSIYIIFLAKYFYIKFIYNIIYLQRNKFLTAFYHTFLTT